MSELVPGSKGHKEHKPTATVVVNAFN